MSAPISNPPRLWGLALIGLAVLLRLGVMVARPDQLTTDRDLYLGIANELRDGHGYATPGSVPPRPTAFRPPLYPLLLMAVGGSQLGIAALHLTLAAVMVLATGRAAERMADRDERNSWRIGLLAGGIVAIDPLLLLYSGQPMTETLCSCLTAVLLWWIATTSTQTHRAAAVEGLLWGLCLLSRPTYAAALGLRLAGWVLFRSIGTTSPELRWKARLRTGILVAAVTLLTVSPWGFRNWLVFGKPILTTTHGGYTLWLANNPVYYGEVVEGDDSFWNGESLNRWQSVTNAEMDRLEIPGEVARDHFQAGLARQFISDNPWRFVRACGDRAVTFWSIFPGRSAETGVPLPILWIIAGWYAAVWVGGVVAVVRAASRRSWTEFWPTASLILGFVVVHLVYWTDARMRAPVMPAVAIFVAWGLARERVPPIEPPRSPSS